MNSALREWRVKNGYTQEKVAQMIGVLRPVVSNWENRKFIPQKKYMGRIYTVTEGEVPPNSFYPESENDILKGL